MFLCKFTILLKKLIRATTITRNTNNSAIYYLSYCERGKIMNLTETMTVAEAAALMNVSKESIYGGIQAGVLDIGVYLRKEGRAGGKYLIPIGRFAAWNNIPVFFVVISLKRMRRKDARRKRRFRMNRSRMSK